MVPVNKIYYNALRTHMRVFRKKHKNSRNDVVEFLIITSVGIVHHNTYFNTCSIHIMMPI